MRAHSFVRLVHKAITQLRIGVMILKKGSRVRCSTTDKNKPNSFISFFCYRHQICHKSTNASRTVFSTFARIKSIDVKKSGCNQFRSIRTIFFFFLLCVPKIYAHQFCKHVSKTGETYIEHRIFRMNWISENKFANELPAPSGKSSKK